MVITDGSFLKMSFTLKLKGSIFLCQCFNYLLLHNKLFQNFVPSNYVISYGF